jgi:hypothetical protein
LAHAKKLHTAIKLATECLLLTLIAANYFFENWGSNVMISDFSLVSPAALQALLFDSGSHNFPNSIPVFPRWSIPYLPPMESTQDKVPGKITGYCRQISECLLTIIVYGEPTRSLMTCDQCKSGMALPYYISNGIRMPSISFSSVQRMLPIISRNAMIADFAIIAPSLP